MTVLFRSENWNENILNALLRINFKGNIVLAAAAIIAPIVYIKVVVVEKLVVGLLVEAIGTTLRVGTRILSRHPWGDTVYN